MFLYFTILVAVFSPRLTSKLSRPEKHETSQAVESGKPSNNESMFFRLGCSALLGAVSSTKLCVKESLLFYCLLDCIKTIIAESIPMMNALVSFATTNPITLFIIVLLTIRSRPSPWNGRTPYFFSCLLAKGSLLIKQQGRSAVPSLFFS